MTDITIMGAGIFGLSIGFACARAGARVCIIDPNGVGAGASGGVVGALAPHTPDNWNQKKAFQLESLLMASAFWQSVSEISQMSSGYIRSGRIQPLHNEKALNLAWQRENMAIDFWKDQARWKVFHAQDLHSPDGWHVSSKTGYLAYDDLSALIHPRQACAALAEAIVRLGGQIVSDIKTAPKGAVLWATGLADLQDISTKMGRTIGTGVKGQGALLRHNAANKPHIFADGVHIVPHLDGTVAIGSTSENHYEDPNTVNDLLNEVIAKARAALPVLQNAPVIECWAGVRPKISHRSPILGKHPVRAGEFIANGGFKIGFGMAPKVATVMAELLLEGRNVIPDAFSALR